MVRIYTGLTVVLAFLFCNAAGQDFSNKGKEFWLAYSFHVGMVNTGGGLPSMTLYLTSDENTGYKVEIFGLAVLSTGNITAGQVVTVTIPSTYFINDEGTFLNKAIRVTADKPIVVYSFITRAAASAATLCLPVNVLGKEYFTSSFQQISNEQNSHSYITIIGVEDNTTVEITPTADTKNGWTAGSTHSVNLNKGAIYQVLGTTSGNTGGDLTGTRVRSVASGTGGCKRIAVFSGSGKIFIGCTGGGAGADNLYQQLYPTGTWGKKYLTAPSFSRPYNYYRVIRSNSSVNVYVNGVLIPSSSFVNNIYGFANNSPNSIEADQPVSVAQYFTSQGCNGNTGNYDPEMIMLNPIEQNIDKVTLVSTNLVNAPAQHHVHVIMRNMGTGLSSFKLDGVSVPLSSWTPHPADPTYSYTYLSNVSQGYHRLESDSGFNALAYGYANVETYGYSAGANVKDLYQFVSIQNQYSTVNFPSTCKNSPFFFSMTFPYQPTEIKWVFGAPLNAMGINDVTISHPVFDSTWQVNGKQLYRYKLSSAFVINTVGTYNIKVLAQNPSPDGCSGEQEINYDVQVFDPPKADFNFATTGCLTDSVRFTDNSSTFGRPAVQWFWDFGDTNKSIIRNPTHLYNSGKTYDVRFSMVTDIGCLSDTQMKKVEISHLPVANFGIASPYCIGSNLVFTDSSFVLNSTVAKWKWNFGDGSNSSQQAPSHSYPKAGQYTVSLQVESQNGCASNIKTKTIKVGDVPMPGFIIPGNCVNDPVSQFIDTSSIADGTEGQFTYSWNFGDGNATTANPNISTTKDGLHKYTATGTYNVNLTVTSNSGCSSSLNQSFTINGAVPITAFSIQGGLKHCGYDSIVLVDNSLVNPGKLVKLEIYWDYTGDPTSKIVVNNPVPGSMYKNKYPSFSSPASKDYTIKVVAYSGISCLSSSDQAITIMAIPDVSFPVIDPICGNAVAFNAQTNVSNMTGNGIFSGKGISSDGLFNPPAAGPGSHTVRYTFTGANGCSDYKEQNIIVFPVPTINAGPDRFVLEGGSTNLKITTTGNNLQYVWSPSTYLNNASIAEPITTPQSDINYTLMVTSSDGCSVSDQVMVKILKALTIPNVFTPNGDGFNDRWEIPYLDSYREATVEVFNRYGSLVYRSVGYSKPWDGTFSGKQMPAGTYYYIINPKNGRKQVAGFVDIVR
jgi:gliding motility-associated-like protein